MSETRGTGIPLKRVQPIHRGIHDVTKAYETLDIVINASNTAAYMAVQDVPVGTALTDANYWEAIVNVSSVVDNVNSAVNANKEELQNNIDANKKETDEAISQLSEEIDELARYESGYFTDANEGNIFTVTNGKYTNGGTVQSLNGYNLYQMTAEKDFTIKCGEDCTNSSHLWICIFEGDISTANCKAKYANDGRSGMEPLPNSDVTIKSGQILTISCYIGDSDTTYFKIETNLVNGKVTLADELHLGSTMRQEVSDEIDAATRKKYLKYDTSGGYVDVYVPTYTGYMCYRFIHTVNTSKNADIWRIDRAYICEENLEIIKEATTDGEWELAFGLYGRPTGSDHYGSGFIGGKQHGNETLNSVLFVVDGKPVDISAFGEITEWEAFEVYKNTTMYDSVDNTTPVCQHASVHVFNDNGVIIKQTIEWLVETQMRAAYMAMFPVAKAVSDTLMVDKTWQRESTIPADGTSIKHNGAKYAVLFKDSEGFMAKFYVTEYPSGLDVDGDYFLCTDNTMDYSGAYNKCYYAVTGNNGSHAVKSGNVWKSETHYELSVHKS